MKKANFSLVLTAMVFFMFLGVQSFAQNASEIDNPLTNKVLSTNGVSLVSDIEAIDILSAEYKSISQNLEDFTTTANEEATVVSRLEYMEYLIGEIMSGAGVKATLEQSGNALETIISKYNASVTLNSEAIYLDTRALLEL